MAKVLCADFRSHNEKPPQHLAIIMDGNGRWAKQRHLPRIAGHKAGVESVRRIVKASGEKGIAVLTLFAFSSENWSRPKQEVQGLMQLFIHSLKNEVEKLHKNNVQLRIIGNKSRLSDELKKAIDKAECLTEKNSGLKLLVAVDYGGQWDIVQATQKLGKEIVKGNLLPENISVEVFQEALSTHSLPPVDLLIRPSGEQRISNFMLWQLAYAELYFTDILWPDFDESALEEALQFFANRERRFGGIGKDVHDDIVNA